MGAGTDASAAGLNKEENEVDFGKAAVEVVVVVWSWDEAAASGLSTIPTNPEAEVIGLGRDHAAGSTEATAAILVLVVEKEGNGCDGGGER